MPLVRGFVSRVPLVALLLMALPAAASGDEGWRITRFDVDFELNRAGTIQAVERIDVDFGALSRHGIYRDLVRVQRFDAARNRIYAIDLSGVTNAQGVKQRAAVSDDGATRRFKIGDPNRTVTGPVAYRVAYTLGGALNAFPDHDELYWNVTGAGWPVAIDHASVQLRIPAAAVQRVDCFEGFRGSTERCAASFSGRDATFTATRPLRPGEELTVVAAWPKGIVRAPQPELETRPRDSLHFFDRSPALVHGMTAGFVVVGALLAWVWWRYGRDRRFLALQRAGADTAEERVPLFGGRPIAVEFKPPEGLRPGEMGLLVDEHADTLDVTATIVDLAVRGYLSITELERTHWFSRHDWELTRLKEADDQTAPYERIVLTGLFEGGSSVALSALKKEFYRYLAEAKSSLYATSVSRGWFARNPQTVRVFTRVAGWALLAAGCVLTFQLGRRWGLGLLGLPVIAGGMAFAGMSRLMPRRSALGLELTRRSLGFQRYLKTAETGQQAFAERANLFTAYLPYAVMFRCVGLWARRFQDIDLRAATAGWYAGRTSFDAQAFSSNMSAFSSSVSNVMASTPGGSGGSGFGGGSSGGGGGGGGGGSW